MNYFNFPTKPIGGGNPYHCCASCGRSVPEINGDLEKHESWCVWRQAIEYRMTHPNVSRDTLTQLVLWAYDHEEISLSRAAEILQVPLVEFRKEYLEWLKTETEKKNVG